MITLREILWCLLGAFLVILVGEESFGAQMAPPACLSSERAIKEWVETTVHDTPPVGGEIIMLKHYPIKYTDDERVGKCWIVTAVCAVSFQGKSDHEVMFLMYHCDSGKGDLMMTLGIPEDKLQELLDKIPAGYEI